VALVVLVAEAVTEARAALARQAKATPVALVSTLLAFLAPVVVEQMRQAGTLA
jgi:hypothetical protein